MCDDLTVEVEYEDGLTIICVSDVTIKTLEAYIKRVVKYL